MFTVCCGEGLGLFGGGAGLEIRESFVSGYWAKRALSLLVHFRVLKALGLRVP